MLFNTPICFSKPEPSSGRQDCLENRPSVLKQVGVLDNRIGLYCPFSWYNNERHSVHIFVT
jgi:hypothetical protein